MLRHMVIAVGLTALACGASAEEPWKTVPEPAAMPEPAEIGFVEKGNAKLYYARYGEKQKGEPPLLLIHGGLGHADIWAAQIKALSTDYEVIVGDTRGHGRSTNDGSTYSYGLLAEDYITVMNALDVDKVHLIGWSDGANIGFTISTIAPDRLASHFAHAGNVTQAGVNPDVDADPVFDAYIDAMSEDYARMSPTPDTFSNFVGDLSEMWATDKPGGIDSLTSVDVPTTVVQSEHDEVVLSEHAKAIAEAIPGARYVTLDGVSHFAMLQDPKGYVEAIRDHLKWAARQ